MSAPVEIKPSVRYIDRIFSCTSKSANSPVVIFSATVVYMDGYGNEHDTGYGHPRVRCPLSDRKIKRAGYHYEIDRIARDFQRHVRTYGVRFEVAHASWWAPHLEKPPCWMFANDPGDLLAA